MKQYTIKKITGAPNWANIPVADMEIAYHEAKDIGIAGHAQLCWDNDALYVHLWAKEEHIRNELTGQLEEVCQDSCLEFFFRPTESLHYFNFEFNPNCALWLGHGTGENLVRLVLMNQDKTLSPKANRTEDGWEICYRVPFSFIQQFFPEFSPKEGLAFYGNFYKCGDNTQYPHWFSWNDVTSDPLSFHRPQDFGRLILGGE